MASERKIKRMTFGVMKILRLVLLCSCLSLISSYYARTIDIQQVTQRQNYDHETKQDHHLTHENHESLDQLTILGDELKSRHLLKTNTGITRTLREQVPASYLVKIQDFSVLKSKPPRYESAAFDAAGSKWRLIFYPNGKEDDSGEGYISLYVRMENLHGNEEINVDLKLFVYNQLKDKYLTVQDGEIKRFSVVKDEWGFGQLLSLSTFNNSTEGYLVDDTCLLGVELFVIKPSEKIETLSFEQNLGKFTWTVHNFSKIDAPGGLHSPNHTVGERYWQIVLHPNGCRSGKGKTLAVFLFGWDYVEVRTYGLAEVRLLNQQGFDDHERETGGWYNIFPYVTWGIKDFISLEDLHDESKGYLKDNTIIVEVEFDIVSVTKVTSYLTNPPAGGARDDGRSIESF